MFKKFCDARLCIKDALLRHLVRYEARLVQGLDDAVEADRTRIVLVKAQQHIAACLRRDLRLFQEVEHG